MITQYLDFQLKEGKNSWFLVKGYVLFLTGILYLIFAFDFCKSPPIMVFELGNYLIPINKK